MVRSHKQVWDTVLLLQVAWTPSRPIRTNEPRLEKARTQGICKPEKGALHTAPTTRQEAGLIFHKHQETENP